MSFSVTSSKVTGLPSLSYNVIVVTPVKEGIVVPGVLAVVVGADKPKI